MSTHAELSPSGAARWMNCPGSVVLCKPIKDDSSRYADEGTFAHEVAARCLTSNVEAADHRGWQLTLNGTTHTVNDEMVLAVQDYVDYVRGVVAATGGQLLVEQRLPISGITGEADAHGTADAVILTPDELIVVDLKYGRGVPVAAEENPQLQIYALAAYREFSLVQDFQTVRMVIHQPRLNSVSEWVRPVDRLELFGEVVALAAESVRTAQAEPVSESWCTAFLLPTNKGCKFCRAAATCPALRSEVIEMFERVPEPAQAGEDPLADAMSKVDLVETWLKAIRAETEARLLAGTPVRGFKLVQGKRGARKWANDAEAEEVLKAMRVKHDQMYDYSVISPTTAEKLAKSEVIGPRQWPKLQVLITQSDGKPSVAPESDRRPALVMSAVAADFDDVSDKAVQAA